MEIKRTQDSPILLRLIPETPLEIIANGRRSFAFRQMKIDHRIGKDGSLILNIDPAWKDFADDRRKKTWI